MKWLFLGHPVESMTKIYLESCIPNLALLSVQVNTRIFHLTMIQIPTAGRKVWSEPHTQWFKEQLVSTECGVKKAHLCRIILKAFFLSSWKYNYNQLSVKEIKCVLEEFYKMVPQNHFNDLKEGGGEG